MWIDYKKREKYLKIACKLTEISTYALVLLLDLEHPQHLQHLHLRWESMNMGGMDLNGCLLPTHTCIAYLPFVKTINKLKMQERCDNSQNTWDSWWKWSKTHRGESC